MANKGSAGILPTLNRRTSLRGARLLGASQPLGIPFIWSHVRPTRSRSGVAWPKRATSRRIQTGVEMVAGQIGLLAGLMHALPDHAA